MVLSPDWTRSTKWHCDGNDPVRSIAGAALDCFSVEPLSADNPLLQLPQVIVTPRAGTHTDGATNAMNWGALENCLAVLHGEPALNPVIGCEKPS